jgi:hypothetical protein
VTREIARNAEWILEQADDGSYTIKSYDGKTVLAGIAKRSLKSLQAIMESV